MGDYAEGISFDPAALKAKYREERDKRLTPKGNDQYRQVEEPGLRHFIEHPDFVSPSERASIEEDVDFLVIGGGFGGQLAAVHMMKTGMTDIRIVDKAGDFGGTWYWNQYPGIAVDIESYIYMPLCEELGCLPTEKYARGSEILEHSRKIGRHYNLYEKAAFQTEVTSLDWDESIQRWVASTNRGDQIRARFVATSSGPFPKPKLPGVPGIEDFKGHTFHTSRWDYEYTGGDSTGGLTKLADKRVGVVGTGASAVQVVPHLGEGSKRLYVFQRTPSSIDIRQDRPTDSEWANSLTPGWQQRRIDNFNAITCGQPVEEDLVQDGWTEILRKLVDLGGRDQPASQEEIAEKMQQADFIKMEQIRARVDSIVKDPDTAAALKPWYNQMCKRPCFHEGYLPAFNRQNVTLVDTNGQGIERVTEKGIVANGQEYELDCIIYATGFEFNTDYSRSLRVTVTGRNNERLDKKWEENVSTLHGMHTRGFPNLFVMSIIQASFTPNFVHMLGEQAKHAAFIASTAKTRGITVVEPSVEAEQEWVKTILGLSGLRQAFLESCTPGYYNNEGGRSPSDLTRSSYGLGSVAFIKLLEEWRATGLLPGLECDGKPLSDASASHQNGNHPVTSSNGAVSN